MTTLAYFFAFLFLVFYFWNREVQKNEMITMKWRVNFAIFWIWVFDIVGFGVTFGGACNNTGGCNFSLGSSDDPHAQAVLSSIVLSSIGLVAAPMLFFLPDPVEGGED